MKYRMGILAISALLLSACEKASQAPSAPETAPTPAPKPPAAQATSTQAKPAVPVNTGKTTLPTVAPSTQPEPAASMKPKAQLNLEIPGALNDELIQDTTSTQQQSRKRMPELFGQNREKDIELDGGVKLQEQQTLTAPKIDGVEVQLKSRF